MKRVLIAVACALSMSAVAGFEPLSDLPSTSQVDALTKAGWFSDDGWAIGAAVVAMAVIAKRRRR
ncbi:hypothetical protein [Pseudorhodoferax soli]|uniref:hypothetical protein n=1 Tax=Pseudorhodoferax soli TaxID=545864 RepID=UPI000DF318D5|nr:hypothetical protein [Pseudorhodoferax soli]